MFRTHFRPTCVALAACMLTYSIATADDSSPQNQQADKAQAKAAQNWIDQLSTKVDLSSDQKEQIREKLNENNKQVNSAWKKFNEAHAQAVALEATIYAAMEDGMNEQQKQQFRENRKNQQAQNQRRSKSSGSQADRNPPTSSKRNAQRENSEANNASSSRAAEADPTATASNPRDAKSKQASRVGNQSDAQKNRKNDQANESKTVQQSRQPDFAEVYVTRMIIVPIQQNVDTVSLDEQQRQQCDQACQKFHAKLTQAWRDIHRYHDELVHLEAEKLRAVESTLDEGQLQKLKDDRDADDQSS